MLKYQSESEINKTPTKYRMLPTRNMMDDCDFSNAYDIPTIINFIMALEEAKECVDVDAVKKFTGRNILSVSY